MFRAIVVFIFLLILWLLLSGHFNPLLISLGVLSTALVTWIAVRMGLLADGEPVYPTWRLIRYWSWLGVEIIKSNIQVARQVIDPALPIKPRVIRVPANQRTETGRVTYANSITLTPGTVSLEVTEDDIEVHALTAETAGDLKSGDMGIRVMETGL